MHADGSELSDNFRYYNEKFVPLSATFWRLFDK